jgi:hypothetical protein
MFTLPNNQNHKQCNQGKSDRIVEALSNSLSFHLQSHYVMQIQITYDGFESCGVHKIKVSIKKSHGKIV